MTVDKRAWIWPILLGLTLFSLSGTAKIATPDIELRFSKDKIAHLLVFGLLATSILRVPRLKSLGWRGAMIAAAFTIFFGGFDELRQSLTPGRSVELADWIADSTGAILATALYQFLGPYRRMLEWSFRRKKKKG